MNERPLKSKVAIIGNGEAIAITASHGVVFPIKNASDAGTIATGFSWLGGALRIQSLGAYTSLLTISRNSSTGVVTITNNTGSYATLIIIYS